MFRSGFFEWGALKFLTFFKFFVCVVVFSRRCCKRSPSPGDILGFFDEERRAGSDLRGRMLLTWPDKVGLLSFTAALFCVIDAILSSIARIFARNVA